MGIGRLLSKEGLTTSMFRSVEACRNDRESAALGSSQPKHDGQPQRSATGDNHQSNAVGERPATGGNHESNAVIGSATAESDCIFVNNRPASDFLFVRCIDPDCDNNKFLVIVPRKPATGGNKFKVIVPRKPATGGQLATNGDTQVDSPTELETANSLTTTEAEDEPATIGDLDVELMCSECGTVRFLPHHPFAAFEDPENHLLGQR